MFNREQVTNARGWSIAALLGVLTVLVLVAPATGEQASDPPTVCFQPYGKYDKTLLGVAERGVVWLYGFEVQRLDAQPMPDEAYYKPRKRYRADIMLDVIGRDIAPDHTDCDVIVAFTKHDISVTKGDVEDWGIFGLGEVGGKAAIVSTYRLNKKKNSDNDRPIRTVKVTNHEIGHVLGIPHVKGKGCLMNDAEGTIKTVDDESGLLCDSTREWIESKWSITLPVHDEMDWDAILEP